MKGGEFQKNQILSKKDLRFLEIGMANDIY